MAISLLFLIIALVLFILSAFNVASPRVNLTAAGLAFYVAYHLLAHWGT
jgi:hypothetical protein